MTVPRTVPASAIRARLRVIDPHHDLAGDIIKIAVCVAMLAVGIVLRFRPMPERVVGGGMIGAGVLLFAIWGKLATRRPQDRERRLVAALGRSYSITGYSAWLAADVPLFDVTVAKAAPLALAHAKQLDDRTLRVTLPPLPDGGGDREQLRQFLDAWPAEHVIESIEMGGTMAADEPGVN